MLFYLFDSFICNSFSIFNNKISLILATTSAKIIIVTNILYKKSDYLLNSINMIFFFNYKNILKQVDFIYSFFLGCGVWGKGIFVASPTFLTLFHPSPSPFTLNYFAYFLNIHILKQRFCSTDLTQKIYKTMTTYME